MRRRRQVAGVALMMALFIAMLSFFFITLLAVNARHRSGFFARTEAETKKYYLARGAVAELLARLNKAEDLSAYTSGNRWSTTVNGQTVEAWTRYDHPAPGVIHLHAQAGNARSTRVVVRNQTSEAMTFTAEAGVLKSHRPGDSSWTDLPAPLSQGYDMSGAPITFTPIGVGAFSANQSGKLVGGFRDGTGGGSAQIWSADTDSWDVLPPWPSVRLSGGTLSFNSSFTPNELIISKNRVFASENTLDLTDPGHSRLSVLTIYDQSTETYSVTKGPSGGARHFMFGSLLAGKNDDLFASVYANGATGPAQLVKYSGGSWVDITGPAPTAAITRIVAVDGDDLYAEADNQLYKYAGGSWTSVPVPTNDQGQSVGKLDSIDASGALIFQNGSEVYRVEENEEPEELPTLSSFTKAEGGGMPDLSPTGPYRSTAQR